MGTSFSMSGKARNRQPGRGDSPAARINVAEELGRLPSGFAYVTASAETRQRVHEIAAGLLAEEIVYGLNTSRAQFIEQTKSHAVKAGDDSLRRQIESALAADRLLTARADEIALLPAAMSEAEQALQKAEAVVARAEAARDVAQGVLAKCNGLAIQVREARRAIAPTDPVVVFALDHVRALCAE